MPRFRNSRIVSSIANERITDVVFYLLFFWFFNYYFMRSTMFCSELLGDYLVTLYTFSKKLTDALVLFSVLMILLRYKEHRDRIIACVLFMVAMLYSGIRGDYANEQVKVVLLLLICSKNKSFKLIGGIALVCGGIWLGGGLYASQMGYISDLVYKGARHSFGSVYPTDLACHILMLSFVFCVCKEGISPSS